MTSLSGLKSRCPQDLLLLEALVENGSLLASPASKAVFLGFLLSSKQQHSIFKSLSHFPASTSLFHLYRHCDDIEPPQITQESPQLNSLNLIIPANSILPCKVTDSDSRDLDLGIFGGHYSFYIGLQYLPLHPFPPALQAGGGWVMAKDLAGMGPARGVRKGPLAGGA